MADTDNHRQQTADRLQPLLLTLHQRTQESFLHHYNRMLEASKFFFWASSLVLSSSFLVLINAGHSLPLVSAPVSLVLLWVCWILNNTGRLVVIQQREFCAYEKVLCEKLERALGWYRKEPRIHAIGGARDLFPPYSRAKARLQVTAPSLAFEPTALDAKNVKRMLTLTADELTKIREAADAAKGKGIYGALILLFDLAHWTIPVVAIAYSIWLIRIGLHTFH